MIASNHSSHRAQYDDEGNIIIPAMDIAKKPMPVSEGVMRENEWYSIPPTAPAIPAWAAFDSEEPPSYMVEEEMEPEPVREWSVPPTEPVNDVIHSSRVRVWDSVKGQMQSTTQEIAAESARQFETSVRDGLELGRGIVGTIHHGLRSTWRFLTQPVWVPGRNNTPKQYGRGILFLLDIVRFGGTFAALFVVLFVSLNYQSFWAIAQSYVNPLAQITDGNLLSSAVDQQDLAAKLKTIPSLAEAGADYGNLIAYLPPVGPPQNRLIIPKLNLNVPINDPPNTDLINQNWTGLEDDIQKALQTGVVHYPGTARPGQAGNFFVTGHSSYFPWDPGKFKSVFAQLSELNVGDEYWVYYGDDKFRYKITDKKEIDPSDVSVLDQPVNQRISTLMTCTPVGTALHRLIITAQEVDPVTDQPMHVGQQQQQNLPHVQMTSLPI